MKKGKVFVFGGRAERHDHNAHRNLIEQPLRLVEQALYAVDEDGAPASSEDARAELDAIYQSYNWSDPAPQIEELVRRAAVNIFTLGIDEKLGRASSEGKVLETAHPILRAAITRLYHGGQCELSSKPSRFWAMHTGNQEDTLLGRNLFYDSVDQISPFSLRVMPTDQRCEGNMSFSMFMSSLTANFPMDSRDALEHLDGEVPFSQAPRSILDGLQYLEENQPKLHEWFLAHARAGLKGLREDVLYEIRNGDSVLQHPYHKAAAGQLIVLRRSGDLDHIHVPKGTIFQSIDHYLSLGRISS